MSLVALPSPLFRDPIFDCPTDPTVIWNEQEKQWYLFYTQRRSTQVEIDVSWVHGTKIGVATSKDGSKWLYRGTLEGLDIERGHNTFWAPEIIYANGIYHMYVSYITGIPSDWEWPRKILYYTSKNLWDWNFETEVILSSNQVIDACVYEISDGTYKMWYKDETNGAVTYAAISEDLRNWRVIGAEVTDQKQEGPNVFVLNGKKWMISDFWSGLAVYSSDDFSNWKRCNNILETSGTRELDIGLGHHADVVVRDNKAYIFYFCQPFSCECGGEKEDYPPYQRNSAVIQVAELIEKDGNLICDRNASVFWETEKVI